jgi:hypothetical protein
LSDWTLGGNPDGTPSYGNVIVAKAPYRLLGTNRDNARPFLFATAPYQIPAGKTLVAVTLPAQSGDPASAGRIHVFAVADDGTPRPPLELTAGPDRTGTAGQELTAQLGSAPGASHARVQWGDGTVPQDATVDPAGLLSGKHTYAQPGTYRVHVTAWDAVSSRTATFSVTIAPASAATAVTTTVASAERPAQPVYHPQVSLSVTSGPRGTAITVDGAGFAPNETVSGVLGGQAVPALQANADGVISDAIVSVPGPVSPGATGIALTGASSAATAEAPFTVTDHN